MRNRILGFILWTAGFAILGLGITIMIKSTPAQAEHFPSLAFALAFAACIVGALELHKKL